jgi:hypothetical protein
MTGRAAPQPAWATLAGIAGVLPAIPMVVIVDP